MSCWLLLILGLLTQLAWVSWACLSRAYQPEIIQVFITSAGYYGLVNHAKNNTDHQSKMLTHTQRVRGVYNRYIYPINMCAPKWSLKQNEPGDRATFSVCALLTPMVAQTNRHAFQPRDWGVWKSNVWSICWYQTYLAFRVTTRWFRLFFRVTSLPCAATIRHVYGLL